MALVSAPAEAPAKDILERTNEVLLRYVSKPTALSVLCVARQRTGIPGTRLTREELQRMLDSIERSMTFFLSNASQAKNCRRDLAALASAETSHAAAGALVVKIRTEEDIARARSEARQLAGMLGFTLVGQTRLMTAVSELARNIVQYAGEGQIDLNPTHAPRGVEIVARDRGPGIRNLDHVLSGSYQSRLGMGLGLLGVKRLAERFDVRTGAGRGTTITAVLRVN